MHPKYHQIRMRHRVRRTWIFARTRADAFEKIRPTHLTSRREFHHLRIAPCKVLKSNGGPPLKRIMVGCVAIVDAVGQFDYRTQQALL